MKTLLVIGLVVLVSLCSTPAWSNLDYQAIIRNDIEDAFADSQFLQHWKDILKDEIDADMVHASFSYEPLKIEPDDNGTVTTVGHLTFKFRCLKNGEKITAIVMRLVAVLLLEKTGEIIGSQILTQDVQVVSGWNNNRWTDM